MTHAERTVYRLSDAFFLPAEGYEWTANVLNINPGNNQELIDQCPPLKGYVQLISLIRQGQAKGQSLEQGRRKAMTAAIQKLMSGMNVSADQAMELLRIPEEDRAA